MDYKGNRGFSYIEIIVALSLFAILVLAALPLIYQAGRNFAFAEGGYQAHLSAQGIMLAVRDSQGETAARAAAFEYAERLGVESFGVWIFGRHSGVAEFSFGSECAPDASDVSLTGLSGMAFSADASIVVVAVLDEHFNIVGRALGIF
ncbi:MAG: type II secretion system GspH family protein [Defluviitaleaceae bacterium]|nr:type II secretion system GspH family protein [Defluviitaleaceae bacterium]